MADDGKQKFLFDLDIKEALDKITKFRGQVDGVGDSGGPTQLMQNLYKVGAVAGVLGAAFLAVKVSLDWTEEGEQIRQIENTFNSLAASAGIAGEELKAGLEKASRGLIDDTDLMKMANKAMIELGDNANRIPEIMELARKATAVMGGDLAQNFESMSQALAMGNTRALKHMGIIVDNDKALKAYALSIGKTVDVIDDAGRRQALLNAALEVGQKKFQNVDESTLEATNAMKQLGVTLNKTKEIFILLFERTIGPLVRAELAGLNYMLEKTEHALRSVFGTEAQKDAIELEKLSDKIHGTIKAIGRLEKELEQLKKMPVTEATEGALKYQENLIQKNREQLAKLREEQKALQEKTKPEEVEEPEKKKGFDTAKETERQSKFQEELLAMRQRRLDLEAQQDVTQEAAEVTYMERRQLLVEQYAAKEATLRAQVLDDKRREDEVNQLIFEQQLERDMKLAEMDRKLEEDRIAALERSAQRSKELSKGVSDSMTAQSLRAGQDFRNMDKLGKTTFGALHKNAANAFAALGDGSKNASEAMRGFMFGAIADVAENQGKVMLAMGLWPPNPLAIAGGGALIALASYLRSMSGTKSMGGGGEGGGGGGGYGATASTVEAAKPDAEAINKKTVSFNFQGHYFDTEQTRTRLMEMVRESSDATDFNYREIGKT